MTYQVKAKKSPAPDHEDFFWMLGVKRRVFVRGFSLAVAVGAGNPVRKKRKTEKALLLYSKADRARYEEVSCGWPDSVTLCSPN